MYRAAALAFALLLRNSAVAGATQAPITEIGLAECHMGLEAAGPDGFSPLLAFVLTADGRALRAMAPAGSDPTHDSAVFATADIGTAAYRAIAHKIENSSFFELSHGDRAQVVSDTRGTRVSAVRESRRMTWASDAYPTDRRAMIMEVLGAIYDRSRDSRLTWVPATTTADPFTLCNEPVQRDAFRN
jgi:hypothetical protein